MAQVYLSIISAFFESATNRPKEDSKAQVELLNTYLVLTGMLKGAYCLKNAAQACN
jgi:hypothetical protein